jgi:hypothetical protein
MKYLLTLYADEKAGAAIPPEDMAKAMKSMYAYQEALTKAGAFIETGALAPTGKAKVVQIVGATTKITDEGFVSEGGELQVHDGPYAETREQFGGFFVIEAPDMEAALDWAAKCPAAQWGPVEVRPFYNLLRVGEPAWCADDGYVMPS